MASEALSAAAVAEQESVRQWLGAHASHWEESPDAAEVRRKVEVLARFCALVGQEPDELVRTLFRPTPEGPRIRVKRRREVMALIEQFEEAAGTDVRGRRAAGNVVRSFLIHNGVALSAGAIY